MTFKLRLHCQMLPSWSPACTADWQKIIDPPSTDPWPGRRTIGRVYVPDGESNALVMQGAAGADRWFARCRPAYERAPWVHAWEGPNEPPVGTSMQSAALAVFTNRWVELMHAAGRRTVALCLGCGWPDIGHARDLAGALEETDYWGLHEYSAPTMQSRESWLCLRYRRTVAELQGVGARIPPLLITECGIDGGVIERPRTGWKSFTDRAGYQAQLAWYAGELAKDDYVLAAQVFTAGPNGDWSDFEVDEELARWLVQQAAEEDSIVTLPPEPGPVIVPRLAIGPQLGDPLPGAILSQVFGERPEYYARWLGSDGRPMRGHNGIDLVEPAGTPVFAAHNGQCWVYDDDDYGHTVEVWYPAIAGGIYKTIYAHLSEQAVTHMQHIGLGVRVGRVGWSGNVDPAGPEGSHLHFGFKILNGQNPGYRGWIDPRPFLECVRW